MADIGHSAGCPFHKGEREAQRRAGAGDVAAWAGDFIRDHMPDQHRDFFANLPFLVLAGADAAGRVWVTLVDGPDGFVRSPSPRQLTLETGVDPHDPLHGAFQAGTEVGMIGISLATRRRNRMNGMIRSTPAGFAIDVRQSFGNCPQYIHERVVQRVATQQPTTLHVSDNLSDDQIARIRAADTLFMGSGHAGSGPSGGYDASHRGGAPGFVEVADDGTLSIPDYAGNNFFNTIGNLLQAPEIGLVFVDFNTGGLLHVTGKACVDWHPKPGDDPAAQRVIHVTVDQVIDRPAALGLRWSQDLNAVRSLRVARKVKESDSITSFHLVPSDGVPLAPFRAGQHLPVEVEMPGEAGALQRAYSLSGPPGTEGYRISVKREPQGAVSRYLHDHVSVGDQIAARVPAGEFVVPDGDGPLVLVSTGVGITPLLAMLHAILADTPDRPVWFVHGTQDGREHAFAAEVGALVARYPNLARVTYYNAPGPDDQKGVDFDYRGRITAQTLAALNAGEEAIFLLCGSAPVVGSLRSDLEASGVRADRIQFELIGAKA